MSRYQKKHSPIHHPDYHPMFISFFHLLRSIASSLFELLVWQSFCTTSLHVWSPPPHIPYISSPNQCLLFATHAHTITTYSAVLSRLLSFILSLSTPYLELYHLTLTLHIYLTILIFARWSATLFSFQTGQVSLQEQNKKRGTERQRQRRIDHVKEKLIQLGSIK